MRRAHPSNDLRSKVMLAACLCMVVLGFLHTHGFDGSERAAGSHFCFACSVAPSADVETGQSLPEANECPGQLALVAVSSDPQSPATIVFSARAPPRPVA